MYQRAGSAPAWAAPTGVTATVSSPPPRQPSLSSAACGRGERPASAPASVGMPGANPGGGSSQRLGGDVRVLDVRKRGAETPILPPASGVNNQVSTHQLALVERLPSRVRGPALFLLPGHRIECVQHHRGSLRLPTLLLPFSKVAKAEPRQRFSSRVPSSETEFLILPFHLSAGLTFPSGLPWCNFQGSTCCRELPRRRSFQGQPGWPHS